MSIGEIIKAKREEKRLSQSDLARELHTTQSVIEWVEKENFKKFGAHIYAKGFIRMIARYLDLDPDLLLAEYKEKYESNEKPAHDKETLKLKDNMPDKHFDMLTVSDTKYSYSGVKKTLSVSETELLRRDYKNRERIIKRSSISVRDPIENVIDYIKMFLKKTIYLFGEGGKFIYKESVREKEILKGILFRGPILNRILWWILFSVIALFVLSMLYRFTVTERNEEELNFVSRERLIVEPPQPYLDNFIDFKSTEGRKGE